MADVKRLTPPLGAYGKFELKSPWSTGNNISYRCVSLRRIEEFVKTGTDLYQAVYEPMQIQRSVYEDDIALGVVIVGLLSTDGDRLFVPDTYILRYPDQNAVTLDYLVLSVDLGPQPSNIELGDLMDELKITASKFSGISPSLIDVGIHSALSTTVMTQEEYISAEDARLAAIENNETTEQVIARLNNTVAEQQRLIEQLLTPNP